MDPDGSTTREDVDRSLIRPFVDGRTADTEAGSSAVAAAGAAGPGLRPYLLTGGRVGSDQRSMEIETQVEMTERGIDEMLLASFERREILQLCQRPIAVAEIAAQLNLHLGVVRVLVGDLVAEGRLATRRPEDGLERSVPIIERVIRGLHAIR